MRLVKNILIALVMLIVIVAAIGFLLPSKVTVSRSTVIDRPVAQVFPFINDLNKFNEWSPWAKIDPDARMTIEGGPGAGQKMTWSSDNDRVGKGTQEITESVENERVETMLDFGEMGSATVGLALAAEGEGTKVTWSFATDLGSNPLKRYFGLKMDDWIGAEYDKGLANLKKLVEAQPLPEPEKPVTEQPAAGQPASGTSQ